MSDNNLSHEDLVNDILGSIPDVETMEVKLPSLGRLYGLNSEYVHLRAMTFEDEKALLRLKNKNEAVNLLISRCVEENINPRDLIPQDKIFLVVNIRNLSVGPNYDINITCGNCNKVNPVSIDVLETFSCDYPEEPLAQTTEIELPVIKKKVVVRRATSDELEQPQEKLYNDIWKFVHSIEGIQSGQVIYDVVSRLPRKDIHAIVNSISCSELGLNTKFLFICSECEHEEVNDLTMQPDFFTMR